MKFATAEELEMRANITEAKVVKREAYLPPRLKQYGYMAALTSAGTAGMDMDGGAMGTDKTGGAFDSYTGVPSADW